MEHVCIFNLYVTIVSYSVIPQFSWNIFQQNNAWFFKVILNFIITVGITSYANAITMKQRFVSEALMSFKEIELHVYYKLRSD